MSIRSPDSTFFADYKCPCNGGTLYIYLKNQCKIPDYELINLSENLNATLEDAVKFERYLKRMYSASVVLKIIKNDTKEILVVDEDDIQDFTNIIQRLKEKFFNLYYEKVNTTTKKNNTNYLVLLFLCMILLTGAIPHNPSHQIILKRGEVVNFNVQETERFRLQWKYSNNITNSNFTEIP